VQVFGSRAGIIYKIKHLRKRVIYYLMNDAWQLLKRPFLVTQHSLMHSTNARAWEREIL